MYILNFSIPKRKYHWVRTKISPGLLSRDMKCIVFSCVVYFRLKAFGKKRENKPHGKISHSTVYLALKLYVLENLKEKQFTNMYV